MSTTEPAQWIKATASQANGTCVEVRYHGAAVEVRDTKQHGEGPTLRFAPGAFTAWIEAAKKGELDHLV